MTSSTPPPPAPPRSRLRRWGLEAAIVVAVFVAVSVWQTRGLLPKRSPLPAFDLATLDGGRITADTLLGKRAVLHFWATWCGVCEREPGALNAVHAGLDGDEVLVAIAADGDDVEAVQRFVAEHDVRYPVALASPAVARSFRVSAYPTNYFVAEDGTIRGSTVGMSTRFGLRARLWAAGW